MIKFNPINIVQRSTPVEPVFTPSTIVVAGYEGIFPQSAAQLIQLDRDLEEKPVKDTPLSKQTMESTQGKVQLPNGKFVTQEQYDKLQQFLKNRK